MQYSPPQGLEAIFFPKWFEQTKKISSFGKGTARLMFCICLCRKHLLWAFTAGILRKAQPWDIYVRLMIAKCTVSLEDDYCVLFFNLKCLIPTLHHMFYSPKPSNIYRKKDFVSSILQNKLEKYTFLWFKKETYFWWEENIS